MTPAKHNFLKMVRTAALASVATSLAGCGFVQNDSRTAEAQRARDEKTREEVARATENAKPALQQAGRELGAAAKTAAEDAKAAVQGVREGWQRGGKNAPLLDINAASEADLVALPGINHHDARKIIAGRPYRDTHDLVSRGILTQDSYDRISEQTTAIR